MGSRRGSRTPVAVVVVVVTTSGISIDHPCHSSGNVANESHHQVPRGGQRHFFLLFLVDLKKLVQSDHNFNPCDCWIIQ